MCNEIVLQSDFDTKTIVDLAKPRIYDRKFHLEEVEKAKRDREEKEKQSLGMLLFLKSNHNICFIRLKSFSRCSIIE